VSLTRILATTITKITATKIAKNTVVVRGSCGTFVSFVAGSIVPFVAFVARSAVTSVAFVGGCFVPIVAGAQTEAIAEIRVHGNHTTPDADVIGLSGLAIGEPASEERLRQAEDALRASRRFENVEVRKRYRSIENPAEILIILLVDEHAAVSAEDLTPSPIKRFLASEQWLPILNYEDGYGLTYGVQFGFANTLGDRSRLSIPLTWGGERRAALELERSFDRGPFSRVSGAASIDRRVNPHYEASDLRQGARVEAERSVLPWLRVAAHARIAHVDFGGTYAARHWAAGAHITVDTRIDPSFPRNAIHVRTGWERLAFPDGHAGRWLADARGYVGVGGSAVLALRAQVATSSHSLPAPEQVLLGGKESLRGYRAGYAANDNLSAFSAEVRYPLNSPLNVGRFGVKGFVDAGTTWASEGPGLSDQRFERGIGGGVYFGVAALILDLDVAWPESGNPRVHFGFGIAF
jgi:outer membrane protein assembly factor BamA